MLLSNRRYTIFEGGILALLVEVVDLVVEIPEPPDLSAFLVAFSSQPAAWPQVRFVCKGDDALIPPFTAVRGLGETAALDTVEKRKGSSASRSGGFSSRDS